MAKSRTRPAQWYRAQPTLNLGLNYVYQEVPFTARLQTLNSIADVPGVLTFGEPEAQKKNFAPRFGLAYAPDFQSGLLHKIFGASDQSSIRASFVMAYDTIPRPRALPLLRGFPISRSHTLCRGA